jgi:hypothetical protein
MFETAKEVGKRTKKWSFLVLVDIIWCAIKYGAGYNDYLHFGLYQLNHKDRKTYITRGYNNKLVAFLNNKNDMHKLDNKNEFNKLFDKFVKREWFYLDGNNEQEFHEWIKDKKIVIAKPNNGSGGVGIKKLKVDDFSCFKTLLNYLKENKLNLIEEVIEQVDYLNKIYDKSVNTIRIITITNNKKTFILTSFLRVGNGGFVDNTCSGGMVIPIDEKVGKTIYPATDLLEHVYYKHPTTEEKLVGIEIKDWEACVKLVEEASQICPNIKYIGWDVAVTPNGPCLVEGNPYPGYYYQFPIYLPNKEGFIPKVENILEELELKLK